MTAPAVETLQLEAGGAETTGAYAKKAHASIALRGAQARSWRSNGHDLLWTPDPAFWHETSPLLFPVVGWTRGGMARVSGRLHPLSLHGFARHLDFSVVDQSRSHVRLATRDSALTRSLYPFNFALEVDYHLSPSSLTMAMQVTNTGRQPMPYACGFHPGFNWPFAGGRQEDYAIMFETAEVPEVPVIAPGGLMGKARRPVALAASRLPLSPALFAADALCFLNPNSRRVQFCGPGGVITMSLDNLAHMALWSRPAGGFLCVEAWSGYSDPEGFAGDLREKPSMQSLPAGTTARHAVSYEFSPAGESTG